MTSVLHHESQLYSSDPSMCNMESYFWWVFYKHDLLRHSDDCNEITFWPYGKKVEKHRNTRTAERKTNYNLGYAQILFLIADLHKGSAVCVAVCAGASTSANPAAQCHYEPTLRALFFQAAQVQWSIRTAILFTSGFRSQCSGRALQLPMSFQIWNAERNSKMALRLFQALYFAQASF